VSAEQGLLSGVSGLLPIQQWYLEKDRIDVSHFNQSVLLSIDKAITKEIFNEVVQHLTAYHDALRFRYYRQNGQWLQEYEKNEGAAIVEDQLSATENLSSLVKTIGDKYQRSLDIEKGEIFRVVLIQTPQSEKSNRLLMIIHHLAVDGVSWRILLEDLEILLTGITKGEKIELGNKSSSYRQWYNALEQYGQTKKLLSQKSYWQDAVKNYKPIKTDKDYSGEVKVKDTGHYMIGLGTEQTQKLLQEVPKAYHTEINDILLAALAKTICEWSETDKVIIGLEGHGREHIAEGIETNRTVGWFTTLYPLLLKVELANGEDELIKSVKEQLRQVPDKGLGYGVLRYTNKEETFTGKETWDIVFNYLGHLDNVIRESYWLSAANESSGSNRSAEHILNEKLSVNGSIRNGELVLHWGYSNKHFNEGTVQKLAAAYITNLNAIIIHCIGHQRMAGVSYTPSDYGLDSKISYKELDKFLAEPYRGKQRRDWIEGMYRLSGLQQGMLFHGLYDDEAGAYVQQFSCDLTGVDLEMFEQSWQTILSRHSILRSAFYHDALKIPVQCVYKRVKLPVELLDYSALSKKEQLTVIKEYEEADRSKGFDFKTAPIMRFALMRLSKDRYHLLWTYHHILFDGWSMPILMEELLTTYELMVSGKEIITRRADNYEDYIRFIEQRNKDHEEKYWSDYLKNVEQGTLLPFVATNMERTKGVGLYKSVPLKLDTLITTRIQGFAQQHRLTVNTLMQGVWSWLLHKYTGSSDIFF
jgi:non-ribosomal peptide synthase protein (TIGR01720 family)